MWSPRIIPLVKILCLWIESTVATYPHCQTQKSNFQASFYHWDQSGTSWAVVVPNNGADLGGQRSLGENRALTPDLASFLLCCTSPPSSSSSPKMGRNWGARILCIKHSLRRLAFRISQILKTLFSFKRFVVFRLVSLIEIHNKESQIASAEY